MEDRADAGRPVDSRADEAAQSLPRRAIELLRAHLPGNSAKIRLLLDLSERRPERVLDVGCGDLSLWAAVDDRPHVVGVDVELPPPRVDGIERRRGSATELPFDAESFDAVVSTQMLDDVPARRRVRALSEMERVLVHGGALFLTCDAGERPRSWRARLRSPRGPYLEELSADAERAGLDVEQLRRYGRRDLKDRQPSLSGDERYATMEEEERAPILDVREWGLLYLRARKP